jgi:hypothetical protein
MLMAVIRSAVGANSFAKNLIDDRDVSDVWALANKFVPTEGPSSFSQRCGVRKNMKSST